MQEGNVIFNDAPDDQWVNEIVAVAEDVAEINDPAMIGNSLRQSRREPQQTMKRFGDE